MLKVSVGEIFLIHSDSEDKDDCCLGEDDCLDVCGEILPVAWFGVLICHRRTLDFEYDGSFRVWALKEVGTFFRRC